jgi:hypothetical protein
LVRFKTFRRFYFNDIISGELLRIENVMLETYKAKLRGNRINWNGETPNAAKGDAEVEVFVTILAKSDLKEKRPSGLAAGEFVVPEDFDEPLPEDVLSSFEN